MENVIAVTVLHVVRDTFNVFRQLCKLMSRALELLALSFGGMSSFQKLRSAASRRPKTSILVAASGALAIVSVIMFSPGFYDFDARDVSCQMIFEPKTSSGVRGGPQAILALALRTKGSETWTEGGKTLLKQCSFWERPQGTTVPLRDLQAQLRCHSIFVETMEQESIPTDGLALIERTRAGLVAVAQVSDQCASVQQKLSSVRRLDQVSHNPREAIVALGSLAGLEEPARDAFGMLKLIGEVLEKRMEAGDWDAEDSMHEVPPLRIKFRGCMLMAVRVARTISHSLLQTNSRYLSAQRCKQDFLVDIERLAFSEAEEEADPGVIFNAGVVMSEASMTTKKIPLFGENPGRSELTLDDNGLQVTTGILTAEAMLLRGFQASFGPDETERASLRSIRICQHASFLQQLRLMASAELRFRLGAQLASKYGRNKLASHCLAQLSFMLSSNGAEDDALATAGDALKLGSDPLASFMQVTLRSNLGLLRTDRETRAAAQQLAEIQGKLHAVDLEDVRTKMHDNFVVWDSVAQVDTLTSCFHLGDAAQVVICVLARMAYA
jgi:hypothetical protein|eukprot:TRINITY_DN74053_c0_g1_i1.p1 TRINITY_DN74053_c0_g1~~TRINITY_DN74053_c0_g1_i1.p1  ORF type:complete len:554 (+),score=101.01 TRINITY_DN74053_c0_g1_i1:169-1830(+)